MWVPRCEGGVSMNPKSHGRPPPLLPHTLIPLLIPAVSEALLELQLLWRPDAFWYGGVVGM